MPRPLPPRSSYPHPSSWGSAARHATGRAAGTSKRLQRGDPDHPIDNPGRWDGKRVNELCGRCHRTERDLDPLDRFSLAQTQRFQPIGLARSACFRASGGRLSCVTCHDAHEDASLSPAHYEAVCLSCHSGGSGVPAFRRSGVRTLLLLVPLTLPVLNT